MSVLVPVLHRVRGAAMLAALAALALAPCSAHAAKLYSGKHLVVAEADTIHDDVYASGGEIVIRGVVDGDVVVCGGRVTLDGTVDGDVLAAGGNVEVDGAVNGTVRAAGGKVRIGANVSRDVVAAGGNVDVLPDARIGRDALLASDRTDVDGQIARNAKIGTNTLMLGEKSVIGGDLDYASDRSVARMSSATVGGKITWHARDWQRKRPTAVEHLVRNMWHAGRFGVGVILIGLLFVLIFPVAAQRALERFATQPLPSAATGLLVAIVLPIAASALLLIGLLIGGWWAGAFLMAVWGIGLVLGVVVAAMTLGRWIGSRTGAHGLALAWSLVLGAFVLMIIRLIPLVGWLVVFGATIGGLGALSTLVGGAISAARAKPAA